MPILTPIKRDVLTMLQVELRQAQAGTWELQPNADGIDVDFVEMLEETIEEIERLRAELNSRPVGIAESHGRLLP